MQHCLIISRSSRALVESAARAGFVVHAIDAFADEDCKNSAETATECEYDEEGFVPSAIDEIIKSLVATYPISVCIIGSGIQATQFKTSNYQFQLIKNTPETICQLQDPFYFSTLLKRNNIVFPKVFKNKPNNNKQYLNKLIGKQGGEHITFAEQTGLVQGYFQEFVKGKTCSVVFLSDGKSLEIVGFNEQYQYEYQNHPFLYAGAFSIESQQDIQERIKHILSIIVKETGVKGLCGMDYIIKEDNEIIVLEVNSRPPASFELHEAQQSLITAHLACFLDNLGTYNRCPEHRGYMILYADDRIMINDAMEWPHWAKDKPAANTIIHAGQPICSVHASAESTNTVKRLLSERKKTLNQQLYC